MPKPLELSIKTYKYGYIIKQETIYRNGKRFTVTLLCWCVCVKNQNDRNVVTFSLLLPLLIKLDPSRNLGPSRVVRDVWALCISNIRCLLTDSPPSGWLIKHPKLHLAVEDAASPHLRLACDTLLCSQAWI